MKRLQLSLVVAGALALASAGAAQAFTFTDQNGNAGDARGYVDLDTKSVTRGDVPNSRFDGQSKNTLQSGNSSIQFTGPSGSFNQRYDSSNLFDPYARDGR